MQGNLIKLENLIGHKFADIALLERATTHTSWAYENHPGESDDLVRGYDNESMEFLGDAILGLLIAEQLFVRHPQSSEGDLTLMKHRLVSTMTLAALAEKLELGNYIRVGRGEEKTGGRRKQALLADALEAIIGAVFLDGGYTAARLFVKKIFSEELRSVTPEGSVDYKTMLQELLQAEKQTAPRYNVVKTEGPPHARMFSVEAVWATGRASGCGPSIKSAEMMAAAEALKMLNG